MGCDMCGQEGTLYNTTVEGTSMQLCNECKGYGEVTSKVGEEEITLRKRTRRYHESTEQVKDGYAQTIKQAREKTRLTQEQLANKLAIKLSQLHKYETGTQAPDIQTAKKLEKTLSITLVTTPQEDDDAVTMNKTSSGPLTIADLIKKKQ